MKKKWMTVLMFVSLSAMADAPTQGQFRGGAFGWIGTGEENPADLDALIEDAKRQATHLAEQGLAEGCGTRPITQITPWIVQVRDANHGFGITRVSATATFGCAAE